MSCSQHLRLDINISRLLKKAIQIAQKNTKTELKFEPLKTDSLEIFVFFSFNSSLYSDMSSRLKYIILLEYQGGVTNIIHYSSRKYKRVTRSVLVVKRFEATHAFEYAINVLMKIREIFRRAGPIPLYIDLPSLYDAIVGNNPIMKKRLSIDFLTLL